VHNDVVVWMGSVAYSVSGVSGPILTFDSYARDISQQIHNFKGD